MTVYGMTLFLGLDLSTQSLKAVVTNQQDIVVCERTVNFDEDLPQYGTVNGAISGTEEGVITCPVALWIEALELAMDSLKDAGVQLNSIVGVSGDAQQHGSVYWSHTAAGRLANLDPYLPLRLQLIPEAFSQTRAPIWQDSSTREECDIIEAAAGGPQMLSDLTGSRAYERFTGSQILKVCRRTPKIYEATARISLVSSFLATLFLCQFSPLEVADASGMNLMNVTTRRWEESLLQLCGGPSLREKLGEEPLLGGTIIGKIGVWWVKRYGFHPDCIVSPFTGDNPATIVTHSSPGDAILSLGTSTTLLISVPAPSQNSPAPACTTTSHILAHPTIGMGSIIMLCIKNGALTRDLIMKKYAGSWEAFNAQILSRPTGNEGCLGFYFTLKEIIPDGVVGDHFFVNGQKLGSDETSRFPETAHARAVLESQLLSIKNRMGGILQGGMSSLERCILTGGASVNPVIRSMAADILGLPVYVAPHGIGNSAAAGGAILAKYAWWKASNTDAGNSITGLRPTDTTPAVRKHTGDREEWTFEQMRNTTGGLAVEWVADPDPVNVDVYNRMVGEFRRCEELIGMRFFFLILGFCYKLDDMCCISLHSEQ
ncbi:uncharacterized protein EI90DRAFT_3155380 [Cantharellus anzutake]|uniref:uncharacterized protein n=1 Tax=Cantharellus anzutake TaxID=1750568 RepID=UPI00190608FC|nr:uncharacterized protein EI90DRAFT_3155380 [Cantharellus anzutake]KAF8329496.1 hypothetical protein EI90DRAFT_3155380 [Cantharellus anzutake]